MELDVPYPGFILALSNDATIWLIFHEVSPKTFFIVKEAFWPAGIYSS